MLSDLHGVTGRAMMQALIAGQRDPRALARLDKGRARQKTERLEQMIDYDEEDPEIRIRFERNLKKAGIASAAVPSNGA